MTQLSVEVPTEKRVKRWSLNVFELVKDPIGRQVRFRYFATV